MYTSTGLGAVAVGGAGLAATGANLMWVVLAGFALVGAGSALLRLIPRRQA
jgi:hypothetical protein